MYLLLVIVSYFIGAFPSAYFAGRFLKGLGIRRLGDRNMGASNVYRHVGHAAGIVVLAADIGKGAITIMLAQRVASQPVVFLCGLAVVAGHNWPVFLKFKGGRGLAATIGVLLALLPVATGILLAACVVPFIKTHNPVITGTIIFAPLSLLAWRLGASPDLILYCIALPCFAGLVHFATTRNLTREQKREALYM